MSDEKPLKLVTAPERQSQSVVEVLEAILRLAKEGKITKLLAGYEMDDGLVVEWAGKPYELLGIAVRIPHVMNVRMDETREFNPHPEEEP